MHVLRLPPRVWGNFGSRRTRIGACRREIQQRTDLFVGVVAKIITNRAADIDYVDLRYSNGFTIGWSKASRPPAREAIDSSPKIMASRGEN